MRLTVFIVDYTHKKKFNLPGRLFLFQKALGFQKGAITFLYFLLQLFPVTF